MVLYDLIILSLSELCALRSLILAEIRAVVDVVDSKEERMHDVGDDDLDVEDGRVWMNHFHQYR